MDWQGPPKRGPSGIRDFEEVFQRFRQQFRFRGPKGLSVGLIMLLAVIIGVGYTSFYTVAAEESAVILRFGKVVRTTGPGLHFKLPFGVEMVRKVKTGRNFQTEFGYRTAEAGVRTRFVQKGFEHESLMLSGDLNVVDVQWTVQYKIQQPTDYLFEVRDVPSAIRDVSESVMRQVVGNRSFDFVLTVGRPEIAAEAKAEMQKVLNSYKTGIQVVNVKLQNVTPPESVKPAFNEVNEAEQERESKINQAQAAYNREIPKAKGNAQQMISEAEGYGVARVNRAKGEAERFLAVLKQYRQAEDVTKRRLYLEAMEDFLNNVEEIYVIDAEQKGLIPLLDLKKARGTGQ
ncbi:MAG: FtsH protease activity modulator HflK [Deltaproteobacteria bacterium]|nr:FtsH protease activity modulator HflK [Deltaproteobacteria bacterium]MBW2069926.1 FtsH protease activity modulator HflK [Deltaproteobacteria bacterium]